MSVIAKPITNSGGGGGAVETATSLRTKLKIPNPNTAEEGDVLVPKEDGSGFEYKKVSGGIDTTGYTDKQVPSFDQSQGKFVPVDPAAADGARVGYWDGTGTVPVGLFTKDTDYLVATENFKFLTYDVVKGQAIYVAQLPATVTNPAHWVVTDAPEVQTDKYLDLRTGGNAVWGGYFAVDTGVVIIPDPVEGEIMYLYNDTIVAADCDAILRTSNDYVINGIELLNFGLRAIKLTATGRDDQAGKKIIDVSYG